MRLLPIVLAITAAPACISVATTPLNAPPHALVQRAPSSVEIFSSGPPSRPHTDYAVLRATGPTYRSTASYVEEVREQAAALGCDGIVIGEIDGPRDPDSVQATCIVYTDLAPGIAAR